MYFGAAQTDVFSALGINLQDLIVQVVAFLFLLYLLARFVYPWLMKSVDERKERIDASTRAAEAAAKALDESRERANELLLEARQQAGEILTTAKEEANAQASGIQETAARQADLIVRTAREELSKDIAKARKQLRDETLDLVALTTEKVIGKSDKPLIERILKESQ